MIINLNKGFKTFLIIMLCFSISCISMADVLNTALSPQSIFKNTSNNSQINRLNYLDHSLLLLENTINGVITSTVKLQKTVINLLKAINFSEFLSKKYLTTVLVLYFCLTLMPSVSKSINVVLSPKKMNKTEYHNESYTLDFTQENGDLVKMTINEFNEKIIPLGYYMHLDQNTYTNDPELCFYKVVKKENLPKTYGDKKIELLYVNRIAFFQSENYQAFAYYKKNRLLLQLENIADNAKGNWKNAFFFHGMFESPETIKKAYTGTVLYHETPHILNPHIDVPENIPEGVKSGRAENKYVMEELLAELQVLSLGGMTSKLLLLRQQTIINKLNDTDEHYLAAVWLIGELLNLKDPFDWNYKSSFTVWSKTHELLKMDSAELRNKALKILDTYYPNAYVLRSFKIKDHDILWDGLSSSLKNVNYNTTFINFIKSLDLNSQEQELVQTFTEIMNSPDTGEDYNFTDIQKNIFLGLLNKLMNDPKLSEKLNNYKGLFVFGEKKLYSDDYLKNNGGNPNLNLMASAFFYFLTDEKTARLEMIDTLLKKQETDYPSETGAETEIILPLLFKNLSPSSKDFILKIQNQIEQGA